MSGVLTGKRGLIMGVANERSIAWGIAKAMHEAGAELAFTYQGDAFERRVRPLAESVGSAHVMDADVQNADSLDTVFGTLKQAWGTMDFLVHAIAYSDKAELTGRFADTSRANFLNTMDISCYSFVDVTRRAAEMMPDGGSVVTMTYLGSQRALPNYNIMGVAKASLEANVRYLAAALGPEGIRVNSISAGPIKTLAAAGIGDFKKILDEVATNAPLRRNVTIDDIGNTGAFLCSDLAAGITGENIYVDSGYNIVSMGVLE